MSNIGYLVPEFPSQTHAFFWREVSALRGLGAEVTLVSTRRPPADACRHDFAARAREQTHYVFPPRWARTLATLARRPLRSTRALGYALGLVESSLARRLRTVALLPSAAELLAVAKERGIDHIHVHSCADAAHLAALCRILGGPAYSLTLHGDLPVYGTDHRAKARRAAFVSCVTTPLQRQLVEQVGLSPDNAPVIWMGVDTERFQDAGKREPRRGALRFVTVARLNPTKAHRHALAAMRKARDAGVELQYTIAGDGPERERIEEEVARHDLAAQVTLTGTVSESDVLTLLQTCDAFVLPSVGLGEAAPVSVMEAMACGMPVVCSRIGGTPDMITDGVDGFLVEQGDEQGIADRLTLLANDVGLRARIGAAARARAVDLFDARSTSARLLARIAAAHPTSP